DGRIGVIVRIRLPALALESAELASDEADVGEVEIAIHHICDFIANIFRPREVGAFYRRAEIVALRGVKCESLFTTEFAPLHAPLERGTNRGRRAGEQRVDGGRLNLVDPASPVLQIHDWPPTVRSHIARTLVATAGSSHSSVMYSG